MKKVDAKIANEDRMSESALSSSPSESLGKLSGENKNKPLEIGGPKGPEPTRYGDWETKGRVSDF